MPKYSLTLKYESEDGAFFKHSDKQEEFPCSSQMALMVYNALASFERCDPSCTDLLATEVLAFALHRSIMLDSRDETPAIKLLCEALNAYKTEIGTEPV